MPTRIFDNLDFTDLASGFTSGPVASPVGMVNVTLTDNGTWEIQGTGTNALPTNVVGSGTYRRQFSIDFARTVLGIPDDARITRVIMRMPCILTASANATSGLMFDVEAHCSAKITNEFAKIDESDNDSGLSPRSATAAGNISGAAADIILFDDIDNPITKADLISTYGTQTFTIIFDIHAIQPAQPDGTGSASYSIRVENWTMTVRYEEAPVTISWGAPQPQADGVNTPVEPGVEVTLISPSPGEPPPDDPPPLDFELVTDIDIEFPDPDNPGLFITIEVPFINWIFIEPHLLTFIMPSWGIYQPKVIRIVLHSTQFSGSVSRQMYTIFFASASGMYTLVIGKTSDTLYIEDEPGETIEVKIPNPFGDTGFFAE